MSGDDADACTPMVLVDRGEADSAPDPRPAFLVLLAGPLVGVAFRIDGEETFVGADPACQIAFPDPFLSRRHARFFRSAGRLCVEDLGSRNGTFCNSRRVTTPRPLEDGDVITFSTPSMLKHARSLLEAEAFAARLLRPAPRHPITRVYGAEYLPDRLRQEFHFSRRHGTPLTIMAIEVDRLSTINRLFGFEAGDDIVRTTSVVLREALRREDLLVRRPMDFVAICAGADLGAAGWIGDRLQQSVEARPFEHGTSSIPVTISIGVAFGTDPRATSAERLLDLAVAAAARARSTGGNRISI